MKIKGLINLLLPGKNGLDELSTLNFILIIILLICELFIDNLYLSLSLVLIVVIFIFRMLSKNIKRRRKENAIYLGLINFPKKKISILYNRIKDYNKAMYKRCPKCKQLIKLPLKKGKHNVVCPTCKNKFEVKCNRNEKIKVEIVKNR